MCINALIIIFLAVAGIAGAASFLLELKRDLMMMQQNSYRNERYKRWLRSSGDMTSWLRMAALVVFVIIQLPFVGLVTACTCVLLLSMYNILRLTTAKYKKPLVWTPRARRIYGVAAGVALATCVAAWFVSRNPVFVARWTVALYVLSHVIIMAAVWMLKPVEARINKGYYDDAARILRSMPGLKVIGITGSYGKTSTKHYLNRILQEQWDVLMTPGSYNTTMGVIRTVREMMKPYTEIFICEMGAKNIGDIKEICDLVHPDMGIITAVGEQHLESFKTVENVQHTKFELVDALPADGFAVVNNDFPKIADREVSNVECVRYAIADTADADFTASDIKYTPDGTGFTVTDKKSGDSLTLHTHLVGECNISNLMAAVIVALRLGMTKEKIRYAVEQIEQVEHRLNMKRTPGGVTIIDDAFNSNPHGSRMALDVLAMMESGKRIVITPGMIELGQRQAEANEEFGRHAARCADVAIVVGRYNRDAIMAGLAEGPIMEENIHAVDTFNEAQALLRTIARPGDTVLYENDLPDTFK